MHTSVGAGPEAPLIHVNPAQRGVAGDLYANLSIVVPATLTEREKKPYEGLRDASRFDPLSRFRR